MEIRNDFNQTITPSQKQWFEEFQKGSRKILDAALTRGGYLHVDYKICLGEFRYGRQLRGRRAGLDAKYLAREYDFEFMELVHPIKIY